jgi:hypothetical protein
MKENNREPSSTIGWCNHCDLEFDTAKTKHMKGLPSEFAVYMCPHCEKPVEWWVAYTVFHETLSLTSLIRGFVLEARSTNRTLGYNQLYKMVKAHPQKKGRKVWDKEYVRNAINKVYTVCEEKDADVKRYPLCKFSSERYNKILLENKTKIELMLNKRIVRQWDLLACSDAFLKSFRNVVENDRKVRLRKRWLIAIDFALSEHRKRQMNA